MIVAASLFQADVTPFVAESVFSERVDRDRRISDGWILCNGFAQSLDRLRDGREGHLSRLLTLARKWACPPVTSA
jgi:hypothetical protein